MSAQGNHGGLPLRVTRATTARYPCRAQGVLREGLPLRVTGSTTARYPCRAQGVLREGLPLRVTVSTTAQYPCRAQGVLREGPSLRIMIIFTIFLNTKINMFIPKPIIKYHLCFNTLGSLI